MKIYKAYTYNDLLLEPQMSMFTPSQVNISTSLTANIKLNIPIVSAAMPTVTDANFAINMALNGGLGIIPKNSILKNQIAEIIKVKKYNNFSLWKNNKFYSFDFNTSLSKIKNCFLKNKNISFITITKNNSFYGVILKKDLNENGSLKTLIKLKNNPICKISESNITIKEKFNKFKVESLFLLNDKDEILGLIKKENLPFLKISLDNDNKLLVGSAIGYSKNFLEITNKLISAGSNFICIDSAHGHSKNIIYMIKTIRNLYPHINIIAGNIATKSAASALIKAGANILKVGIGPGSICTTRIIAGIGVPQITAINNVYQVTKNKNVAIIADGGIKYSGDIVKALAAGANCVMLGNMLAGCDESPGEIINYHNKKMKLYYGMGSIKGMKYGGISRYFQNSIKKDSKYVPEGVEGYTKYKGKLAELLFQYCGGIKSGFGYCGAKNIKSLQKNAKFVEISRAGMKEGHVHNIIMSKDAPNYIKR